ncbi:N-acetyltransferase [Maribacter arcticus]|uniref:GNAT family N-acetyltransferase n=1 Tax=Maribacter arcticus TaxID=561365 RepID=UPI0030036A62
MIEKLENSELEVSKKIRSIFQVSYKIEAKLLNTIDFPPLKRPLEDYLKSDTEFFGYSKNGELAGIIEIDHTNNYTHIRSLVVNPIFFRQGIARNLMEFTLKTFDANLFVVETGLENEPASKLYEKYGFIEVKQWDTNHGVRKVKFEKRINN